MSLEPLAELTYTSFDPPAGQQPGPGGWQVKDLRAADSVTANEAEQVLLEHLRWRLQPVRPVPKFPDARALEVRTRRLVHRVMSEPVRGLWHTVEAGLDASGRPGNVFVHALLYDGSTVGSRVVDLWRSPDWLVPFGAGDVAAASLGDRSEFAPGHEITPAALVDFLTEPPPAPDRTQLLGALLDATATAVNGGPGVLLLADRADEAAVWIGAVSHCTSAAVANALSWSTFERGADLTDEAVRGLHVVAVQRDDLTALAPGHGRVVVDLNEEPAGDEQASWTLASGQAVERTAWSELAMATLARDRRYAVAALEALRPSPGERAALWGVRPAVALGIHVLDTDTSELSPARASAMRSFWIDHACAHRDDDAASAQAYVTAAISDDWWLLMPGAPVPALRQAQEAEGAGDVGEICRRLGLRSEQIAAAVQAAGGGSGHELTWSVARAVVLIDFCVRAGVVTDERVVDAAMNTGETVQWALSAFGDDLAREVWQRCGPLDERTKVYLVALPPAAAVAAPVGPPAAAWADTPRGPAGPPPDPDEWLDEALRLGAREVADPSDRQTARALLARLGVNTQQPFMLDPGVLLRPHSEQVAIAVLASLVVDDLPARRFRRISGEGEHRLVVARRLLDGGDSTAPRLAAFAVDALLGAALAERSKAVSGEQIRDQRSPWARLLREILVMDAQRGSRIGQLLVQPPTEESRHMRDVIAASTAGEYAKQFLQAWDADRGES